MSKQLTDKQKQKQADWLKRSEQLKTGGSAAVGIGCAMMVMGVVLMILVAVVLMFLL